VKKEWAGKRVRVHVEDFEGTAWASNDSDRTAVKTGPGVFDVEVVPDSWITVVEMPEHWPPQPGDVWADESGELYRNFIGGMTLRWRSGE
jgi:hypothetical protein